MLVVGLTGGIGSGKTTVSQIFAKLGATIIDTDIIARDLVLPGSSVLAQISAYFGRDILDDQGNLQRRQLRTLIFDNPQHKRWLEKLLHPLILTEVKIQLQQASTAYTLIAIPLLFESAIKFPIQRILVVDTPPELQLQRLLQRDQISTQQALAILQSQTTREQRLAGADDILVNDGSLEYLSQQVYQLHLFYTDLAKTS